MKKLLIAATLTTLIGCGSGGNDSAPATAKAPQIEDKTGEICVLLSTNDLTGYTSIAPSFSAVATSAAGEQELLWTGNKTTIGQAVKTYDGQVTIDFYSGQELLDTKYISDTDGNFQWFTMTTLFEQTGVITTLGSIDIEDCHLAKL